MGCPQSNLIMRIMIVYNRYIMLYHIISILSSYNWYNNIIQYITSLIPYHHLLKVPMIFSPSCQVLKLHPEWAPRGVRRFVSMLRPLGGSQWATNGQINSSNMSLQIISNNNMIITCNFKQLLYVYIIYMQSFQTKKEKHWISLDSEGPFCFRMGDLEGSRLHHVASDGVFFGLPAEPT